MAGMIGQLHTAFSATTMLEAMLLCVFLLRRTSRIREYGSRLFSKPCKKIR